MFWWPTRPFTQCTRGWMARRVIWRLSSIWAKPTIMLNGILWKLLCVGWDLRNVGFNLLWCGLQWLNMQWLWMGSLVGELFWREVYDKEIPSLHICFSYVQNLSSMIHKANGMGAFTGVSSSRRGPWISHIFFADDSLLFCRSNVAQWERLQNILQLYEKVSGQKLNNNKTSMFFSKNTIVADKEAIWLLQGFWWPNAMIPIWASQLLSESHVQQLSKAF